MIARKRMSFAEGAFEDIEAIYGWVFEVSGSHDVAAGFVRRIRNRCAKIGDAPEGGRRRDDILPGLRTIAFERRAVIAYRVLPDTVEILNIFYGGRQVDAFYRKDEDPPAG